MSLGAPLVFCGDVGQQVDDRRLQKERASVHSALEDVAWKLVNFLAHFRELVVAVIRGASSSWREGAGYVGMLRLVAGAKGEGTVLLGVIRSGFAVSRFRFRSRAV